MTPNFPNFQGFRDLRGFVCYARCSCLLLIGGLAAACGGLGERSLPAPPPIEPVQHPVDEDLRHVEGFSEEVLYLLLVAEIAGQREDLGVALENYLRAARLTRDLGVVQRALRIALYLEELPIAEEMAQLWLALDPDSAEVHQALASLAMQQGELSEVARHFRFILESAGILEYKLQLILSTINDVSDKGALFDQLDQLMSESVSDEELLLGYAHLLIRFDQLERAEKHLKYLLSQRPDDVEAALALMALYQQQSRTEQVLAWLEANVDSFPADSGLRLYYARLLAGLERYAPSRVQLETLAEQQPDNHEVQLSLGLVLIEMGLLDQAKESLGKIVRQEDYSNEAGYYLGWIAEQQGDVEEAVEWYQAIDPGPVYVQARIRQAVLLGRRGELAQARQELKTLLERFPEQRIHLVMAEAEILIEQEQYQVARQVYDVALDAGYDSMLLYARAMLAEKMDQLGLLEEDLRHILQREPENVQTLNALGYTLADRTDRYDEAYGLIKKALLLSPDNFYVLDSMGWILYRLKRLEEAIEHLQRAAKIRVDPEVAAHLGEVLWVSGKHKQARETWKEGLEQFPENEKLLKVIERLTR